MAKSYNPSQKNKESYSALTETGGQIPPQTGAGTGGRGRKNRQRGPLRGRLSTKPDRGWKTRPQGPVRFRPGFVPGRPGIVQSRRGFVPGRPGRENAEWRIPELPSREKPGKQGKSGRIGDEKKFPPEGRKSPYRYSKIFYSPAENPLPRGWYAIIRTGPAG